MQKVQKEKIDPSDPSDTQLTQDSTDSIEEYSIFSHSVLVQIENKKEIVNLDTNIKIGNNPKTFAQIV